MAFFKQFRLLRDTSMRQLILAGIPADFADWLDYVAIFSLVAYHWHGGPFDMAVVTVGWGLPYVIVAPLSGVLADHMKPKTAMLIANLGRGLATLSFIFAPNVWVLVIPLFVRGAFDSLFTPSRDKTIQLLANAETRQSLNGVIYGLNQMAKMVGPAIGGALLAVMVPHMVFVGNSAFSLLAFALLLPIRLPEAEKSTAGNESGSHGHPQTDKETSVSRLFMRLKDGVGVIGRSKVLAIAVPFAAINIGTIMLYDTFYVLLLKDFGYPSSAFGLFISGVGVGGILGALLAGRLKLGPTPLRFMASAQLFSAFVVLTIVALPSLVHVEIALAAFVALGTILGGLGALVQIPFRTILQNHAAQENLGRVSSLSNSASVLTSIGAPFLGALIMARWGLYAPFIFGSGLAVILGVVVLVIAPSRHTLPVEPQTLVAQETPAATGPAAAGE